jgi:hypothetical protein
MATELDPVQFGKLINAVETLESKVDSLSSQVAELNEKMASGKGIMVGMILVAGGLGAGAHKVLELIFK